MILPSEYIGSLQVTRMVTLRCLVDTADLVQATNLNELIGKSIISSTVGAVFLISRNIKDSRPLGAGFITRPVNTKRTELG